MRLQHELRAKNLMFVKSVREARDRASLRTQHARLEGLLYEQISPGLRAHVIARRDAVAHQLG